METRIQIFCQIIGKSSFCYSATKSFSRQKQTVVRHFISRSLFKEREQVAHGQARFFFTFDVDEDVSFVHHDEAVAEAKGVLHVVRDHERRELAFFYDGFCDVENFFRRLGVERRRVLVEEQELRLGHRCHEKRQGLALTAREKADLGFETIFEAEVESRQKLAEALVLRLGEAPAKTRCIAAACGNGEVFLDHHARRRAHHGVLEDSSDVLGTLVLGPLRDVCARDDDAARIDAEGAGDGVHQRRLSRAVAADDGHEVAGRKVQRDASERVLFCDCAGIEGLGDVLKFEHQREPPFARRMRAWMRGREAAARCCDGWICSRSMI